MSGLRFESSPLYNFCRLYPKISFSCLHPKRITTGHRWKIKSNEMLPGKPFPFFTANITHPLTTVDLTLLFYFLPPQRSLNSSPWQTTHSQSGRGNMLFLRRKIKLSSTLRYSCCRCFTFNYKPDKDVTQKKKKKKPSEGNRTVSSAKSMSYEFWWPLDMLCPHCDRNLVKTCW